MSEGQSPAEQTILLREQMVRRQIEARGISDPRLLSAMAAVPRETFVDPEWSHRSYDDSPLPIGEGQTISQPYIVARMIEAVQIAPGDRVLEIGTGSGYAAAVLARLAEQVFTVERHETLADIARERLESLGIGNVRVIAGDGSLGFAEAAPFDAILVAAASPSIPFPLCEQLAPGGRLVLPVGERDVQALVRVTREDGGYRREDLDPVRFVPLLGAHGWNIGEAS